MLVGYSGEFCHIKHHSHFLQEMYILVIILLLPYKFRRATPPAPFVTDPRNRRQIERPIEEWCAMTFISDRAYDVRTLGEKTAEKSHRQRIAANFDES